MLTLCTFGECRIEVAGAGTNGPRPRTLAPNAYRLFSIALVLAAEAGRPVPRARLAGWLWPDYAPVRARRALRQTLYRLRGLGVALRASADHVGVAAADVAPTFAARPTAARAAAEWGAGTLRLGRCLPGWTPTTDAFADWVDAYRARQELAARAALGAAAEDAGGDPAFRVACGHALRELGAAPPAAVSLVPNVARAAARVREAHAPSLSAAHDARVPCVGRAAPLARLAARVRAAVGGEGGVVFLVGPPGVGTSRVLSEAARGAGAAGAHVVTFDARASPPAPLACVRALATRLLALPGALGAAPSSFDALRRLADGRALAGALALPRATTGAALRLLGARIGEVAAAAAEEQPLVVALDHWDLADAASRAAVAVAAAPLGHARALVLAVERRTRAVRHARADDARRETVDVPPLDAGAALALVGMAGGGCDALSDADARWCAESGAGRPAAVVALARACVERPGSRALPAALAALLAERRPGRSAIVGA